MLPKNEEKEMPDWLSRAVAIYDSDKRSYGDVLSHDWIRYALDIPVPKSVEDYEQSQWTLLMRVEAFKDYLLIDRHIAIQNVRGNGYRIVPPSEQARMAAEEAMRLVKRGLDKGSKIIKNTRLAELDTAQRRQHTDAEIRLSGIGDLMKRQRRDIFKLFGPEYKDESR